MYHKQADLVAVAFIEIYDKTLELVLELEEANDQFAIEGRALIQQACYSDDGSAPEYEMMKFIEKMGRTYW